MNKIESKDGEKRFFILFGCRKSGKTQLCLPDATVVKDLNSTKKPKIYSLGIESKIQFLDTPPLPEPEKMDDFINNIFEFCEKRSLRKINGICIVVNGKVAFDNVISSKLLMLIELLGKPAYSSCSMIVVTHAEEFSKEKQERYVQEVKLGILGSLVDFCKVGVVFCGAKDKNMFNGIEGIEFQQLSEHLAKVTSEMRTNFFNELLDWVKYFNIKKKRVRFLRLCYLFLRDTTSNIIFFLCCMMYCWCLPLFVFPVVTILTFLMLLRRFISSKSRKKKK